MSTPWRVMIWKIVRSPSLPRNIGFSSAAMFVVVLEKDHHVICKAAAPSQRNVHRHQSKDYTANTRSFTKSSYRFVDSVLVRVDADEVELDAAVEHALLLGCEGAVAFEEKTRVGEETLLLAAECSEDSRRQANM